MARLSTAALVRRIHVTPTQLVLVVTGGGSRAISAMLEVPGASRTVLEATVPYSAPALASWLGARPEQFCSEPTARTMAMVAYQRAVAYAQGAEAASSLAGVGLSASLASDRPKRGPHRMHGALQLASATVSCSLELVKGGRSRRQEETIAGMLVLNLVAEACGLKSRLPLPLAADEQVVEKRVIAPPAWRALVEAQMAVAPATEAAETTARATADLERRRAIFPGAFNPLHDGHCCMAAIAAERLGRPVEFEISILNVDKPPLDFIEMEHRAGQFAADQILWFTRAATFVEKAEIFPNTTFIVGADTIVRIADPKYYAERPAATAGWPSRASCEGASPTAEAGTASDVGREFTAAQACRRAIDRIAAAGCRFLVFGRRLDDEFQSLATLDLPHWLAAICDEVPEEAFRADISSTELRSRTEREFTGSFERARGQNRKQKPSDQ